MLKTGLYQTPANAGKRAQVRAVFKEYRRTAVRLGAAQWRLFFTAGKLNRNATLRLPTRLSARYVQTCQYQIVGQLTGYLGNCANHFKSLVRHSSLDADTQRTLLYLNKYKAWYRPAVEMAGVPVPAQTLRLARNLMRQVFQRLRKPRLARINLALDEKVAQVVHCTTTKTFSRWLKVATLTRNQPVLLPIRDNRWFDGLAGEEKAFSQLNLDETGTLWIGLIKDVAPTPYVPGLDILGLDVGLKHLLASSEGDLLGQHVLPRLIALDRQISTLAANRQRQGLKVRSPRYDALVRRMRGFLDNEVRRTLRQVLLRHRPSEVAVERLDFRAPQLSRRMNRLVQNFGRRVFKEALETYSMQYGFRWTEVEPAYSSQTCRLCGYVDKRNRKGEVFKCLHCGQQEHADVHASRNIATRLREDLGGSQAKWTGRRRARGKILEAVVGGFATRKRLARLQQALQQAPARLTRQRRLDSKPCLAMLSNPHFREVLAPLKLAAQGALYRATQPLAA